MPPKRKAASKAKNEKPKSIEESMSNITVRKTKEEKDIEEKLYMIENMSHTSVVLDKMPDMITEVLDVLEPENCVNEEEPNIKQEQKKVNKGKKPKTKKDKLDEENSKTLKIKKRAASEDRLMIKAEANLVSKSKKRPIDKNALESKLISPTNDPPKRNRRAISVDNLSSDVITSEMHKKKNTALINEDGVPKKNKKLIKKQPITVEKKEQHKIEEKEELKIVEKVTKGKKNGKKALNDEKDDLLKLEENDNEEPLDVIQERPKVKRGVKKDAHIIEDKEQTETKCPAVTKTKRVAKSKIVSPEKSDDSNDKTSDDYEINTSSVEKPKRVRKVKQVEQKEVKLPKRGNRKMKVEDFVEVLQKHSFTESEDDLSVKTGDELPVSVLPDTSEYGDNEIKPTVVKRKIRGRTGKK